MLFTLRKKIKKLLRKRSYLQPLSKQNIYLVDRFSRLFEKVRAIEGAVVECGVYRGRTLSVLAALGKAQGKPAYGFDSFEGFTWQGRDWFKDVSEEKVRDFLKNNKFSGVTLVRGYFKDTLPLWKKQIGNIALLVIDCDFYDSYMVCLDHLWPNVARGGIVLFDEYDAPQDKRVWYEPKKAVDEFCSRNKLTLERDVSGKVYVVKP